MASLNKIILCISAINLSFSPMLFTTSCSNPISFNQLNIIGSLEGISKDNKVKVTIEYKNNEENTKLVADATLKWQGNYSITYDKKNFNIELFEPNTNWEKKMKIVVQDNWPKSNKYTLKANYPDALACHNIVGGNIWADIVHQMKHVDKINNLPNAGCNDGFPIALYINGSFEGLYTWNTRTDEKLFDMVEDPNKKEAMLQANHFYAVNGSELKYPSTYFRKEIDDYKTDGWDIEWCSTDSNDWIKNSFNNFIRFVMTTDDPILFKAGLSQYTDVPSLLDYIIYLNYSCAWDNVANNVMWVTYDGTKWVPSIFDMDAGFGHFGFDTINGYYDFSNYINQNLLFSKVSIMFEDELWNEYTILKSKSLSYDNVVLRFQKFVNKTTDRLYQMDFDKWPEVPSVRIIKNNNMDLVKKFVSERLEYLQKNKEK